MRFSLRSSSPAAVLATATVTITLGALPIFLVGANAVFIREELGFGETALGAAASIYYIGAAGASVPGGGITGRLGASRAMALAAALTLISLAGIGLAQTWWMVALFLAVGGAANGVAFPASALALSEGIPLSRQGLAFGIKQSSGPYATLLAGATVPLVGLTIGWRWSMALIALLTLPVIARSDVGRRHHESAGSPGSVRNRQALWLLSAGAFAVVIATSSFGAFYVESSVNNGIEPALAGTMLAIGSAGGVVTRIIWGIVADRHHAWHFPMITTFLALGAAGFWLMKDTSTGLQLVSVTILVYATGWAWPAVLNFAVVQRSPEAPAAASGIIGTGQYGGGIVGPLVFGFLVERYSYDSAWLYTAAMALVAATLMFFGGRGLTVDRPSSPYDRQTHGSN